MNTPKSPISAIIITLDEAEMIEECLASVAFCAEIILVDSGSSDETCAIAARHGAHIHHRDWSGFGPQKTHALAQATQSWVLSIDADERVSPLLRQFIEQEVTKPSAADGYEIPRKSHFLGRWLRHSGWWPDHVLRLARRDKAQFSSDIVHERMIVDGTVARLDAPLMHYPVRALQDAYVKVNRYAEAGAKKMVIAGKKPGFASAFGRSFWSFFSTYILKRGFLDGREGLINAIIHADQTFQRYLRAWHMVRRSKDN